MFVAHVAPYTLSHMSSMAVWLFQEQTVAWDPISLWKQMGFHCESRGRNFIRHVRLVDWRND